MPPDQVLEPFAVSPGAHVFAFVLGTLFGSFANVCIYRWPPSEEHPRGRSVVAPGSRCSACATPIRWYDNLPLVSYLLLRGRCRHCGAEFSARYLLVEAAVGMLFVATWHFTVAAAYPYEPLSLRVLRFLILAAFFFVLVVITFIDLDHKLILDKITYPAVPIFYGLGLLLPERAWMDGLIGAAVGYGVVRAISDGYYYLTGREGLGYGDGKLLAVIGALLGWQAVAVALFAGSLLGSVIGITALALARQRPGPAPGAPLPAASPTPDDIEAEEPTASASGSAGGEERGRAGEPGSGGGDPDEPGGGDEPDDVPFRHLQLPFGPFLAMGAAVYVFVEPLLEIRFVGF